jgi:hypothetical protein
MGFKMNLKINDLVYNPKTKETGVVIKQCLKSVKVCCEHTTIKGSHCYKYWKPNKINTV